MREKTPDELFEEMGGEATQNDEGTWEHPAWPEPSTQRDIYDPAPSEIQESEAPKTPIEEMNDEYAAMENEGGKVFIRDDEGSVHPEGPAEVSPADLSDPEDLGSHVESLDSEPQAEEDQPDDE